MEDIRLIIWDLDNTFWDGTISEEAVVIPDQRKLMINTLIDRGIMNSISSKNDYESTRNFLVSEDLWDLFVFPQISWDSKGQAIKKIVEEIQLRPESILFIDDNPINLEEAKYFVPKINISSPVILNSILGNPLFQGKNDTERTRLKQYKVLESKLNDKTEYSSNEMFLMESNICTQIHNDCENGLDRIYELIERTNQLNFTKKHINIEQLKHILSNKEYKCGYVTVKDKYGDYGIIGFFAIIRNKAEHFLFSCRTLGLGIEQWVYAMTGYPDIDIVGEPVVELKPGFIPQWVNQQIKDSEGVKPASEKDIRCLIIGGCDLDQTNYYINANGLIIESEFNYNYGNHIIHREHSEILRGIAEYTEEEKRYILSNVPFYDNNVFLSRIFKQKYDVIIYSPLIDYSAGIYESKVNPNIKVVYGSFSSPIVKCNPEMFEGSNKFIEDFLYSGKTIPARFLENLFILRSHLNKNTILILLNGSEQNIYHPEEPDRYLVHIELNEALKEFCEKNENTYLIDVNKFIHSPSDHMDNIRRYKRQIYYNIASEIVSLLNTLYRKKVTLSKNKKIRFPLRIWIKTGLRKMGLYKLGYYTYRKLCNWQAVDKQEF
jgi:FkbH-like protein